MKSLDINEIINPQKSIFVSANAGSGKTYILVTRVLGLLIKGEDPLKILCISFTEAASMEMKNRITERLKRWHLKGLEGEVMFQNLTDEEKNRAKNLYTEIILLGKMPKILTFHGFCMQIIKSFPAESQLSYKSEILTQIQEYKIKKSIFQNLILKEETRKIFKKMHFAFSSFELENSIIPAILKQRDSSFFKEEGFETKIYKALGLIYDENLHEKWQENFLQNFPFKSLEKILKSDLETSFKKNCIKKRECLAKFWEEKNIDVLEDAMTTEDGTLNKSAPVLKSSNLEEEWLEIKEYYISKREERGRILTAELTENLMKIVKKILQDYQEEKEVREAFDFDDLIFYTKNALNSPQKDFILFKIDGGINHILVDEAQDTNFIQWEILGYILEEFFAGKGAERGSRSLFIVGDEKQSIFSFQNAQPEALQQVFKRYEEHLNVMPLQKSYRTVEMLLNFVDLIFTKEGRESKVAKRLYQRHETENKGYGKIEIMKPIKHENKRKNYESELFIMPWEEEDDEESLKEKNATQICEKIIEILGQNRVVIGENCTIKPKDFMLLFAQRDYKLFSHISKKLAESGVGTSFSDSILFDESFPIADFFHLLRFLLNQENRFSLAVVLNSNMFYGKEESDVLELKPLLEKSVEDFYYTIITMFMAKYSLKEQRELTYIANIIKDYKSQTYSPNFEGLVMFFDELIRTKQDFKINLEQDENSVILSTVHSSKGLENRIVFILNSTKIFSKQEARENLVFSKEKEVFILSKKKINCPEWEEAKNQNKEALYEEYLRLFYVALTRAKEEIYIFPEKETQSKDGFQSWYEIAQNSITNDFKETENSWFYEAGTFEKALASQKKSLMEAVFVPIPENLQKKKRKEIATEKTKSENRNILIGTAIHELLSGENITPVLTEEELKHIQDLYLQTKEKFPFLFTENFLSEVEIIQEFEGAIFSGRIDRLSIGEEIEIYDFKYQKNLFLQEKINFQLEKYKQSLAKIYPNKKIKTFVLWVKEGEIEEIITYQSQKGEIVPQLF